MKLFEKKEKSINLYGLLDTNDTSKFLTITTTQEQASEYAMAFVQNLHSEHYKSWCGVNNLKYTNPESWKTYYNNIIDESEKIRYVIVNIKYDIPGIASILRMFGNCKPLGCSFESKTEKIWADATNLNELDEDLDIGDKQKEEKFKQDFSNMIKNIKKDIKSEEDEDGTK